MMKYVVMSVALSAAVACVSAESLDQLSDFQGEGRLLFNTTSLGVSLPDMRAVIALIAIGIVVAAYYLKTAPAPAAYDKNYYEQGYDYYNQDAYNGQQTFNSRYGVSNLSTKMSQLEQAIKKYDGESEDSKDSKQ